MLITNDYYPICPPFLTVQYAPPFLATHHPLVVSNPIDKKGSESMRRRMRWEVPSMTTSAAMYRAAGIAETDFLDNIMFLLSPAGLWQVAELHTLARGTCMANLLTTKGQGRSGFIRIGATCGGAQGQQGILSHIMAHHETSTFSMDLMAIRNRMMDQNEDPGPYKTGLPLTFSLRILQQSTQREKNSVAAVTIRIHYPKMLAMLRADNAEMGDGHAATELNSSYAFDN